MNKCIVCKEEIQDTEIITFSNMPGSAQNIPEQEELAQEKGIPLKLCQCKWCGTVQLLCEPVSYYKDVIRAGGLSTTMAALRKKQYQYLIEQYRLQGKKFLEAGCGGGEFLKLLNQFPVQAYGVEHNRELVKLAQEKGLSVQEGFIENRKSRLENGLFDVFLSFNFLEHQPDPNGMLEGIYDNLTEDGMGLITVPSLEYILEHNSYYELIRDHLVYYTFDTLSLLLEKNGFTVLEKELINRDTLSVIVRKKSKLRLNRLLENHETVCREINEYIALQKQKGRTVALWGASHQGFTIAASAFLEGKVEYIIDSAPFKQGKYAPASHLPIVSPQDAKKRPVDAIIIIAPGYTKEIAERIQKEFPENPEIMVLRSRTLERYSEAGL